MSELLLHDLFDSIAARFGDKTAVRCGDRSYTFRELATVSQRVATALQDRGIRTGDRVCVSVRARAEAVPVYVALCRLGAIFVPLNPQAPDADKRAIIERTEPALIVGEETYAAMTLDKLVLLQGESEKVDIDVDERSTHVIFFTSGTTGAPKGVELSHRTDYLRTLLRVVNEPRGPFVCMFPQFHMSGWTLSHGHWASGDEVVYVEGGDTRALLEALARHRAHSVYAIPAVLRRLLDADRSGYDLSALRVIDTGTSATSPELLAEVAMAFPGTVTSVVYGSTEDCGCLLTPGEVVDHPGSVGRPLAGVQVRITDDGRLQTRSPFRFSRYYRDPEATARAIVDGWYNTGELAEQDEQGYVKIIGRAHDMIRSGGEYVAPVAVDRALADHPAIADVGTAGVPDEYWGEIVTVFVVPRDGHTVDLAQLREHCAGRLGANSHPRRLEFVDAIPRSAATGQIQRHQLVKRLLIGSAG